MFKPNAHISEMDSGEWPRALVSLSRKDISWYRNKINVEDIIINCNSFPNVPLKGSKGCISYNHVLALRQFGYPILGKPGDNELEEMILHDMGINDSALLHKIIRSWEKVHTKGTELRRRNGVARIPLSSGFLQGFKLSNSLSPLRFLLDLLPQDLYLFL